MMMRYNNDRFNGMLLVIMAHYGTACMMQEE